MNSVPSLPFPIVQPNRRKMPYKIPSTHYVQISLYKVHPSFNPDSSMPDYVLIIHVLVIKSKSENWRQPSNNSVPSFPLPSRTSRNAGLNFPILNGDMVRAFPNLIKNLNQFSVVKTKRLHISRQPSNNSVLSFPTLSGTSRNSEANFPILNGNVVRALPNLV